jgi:hypothetical protein
MDDVTYLYHRPNIVRSTFWIQSYQLAYVILLTVAILSLQSAHQWVLWLLNDHVLSYRGRSQLCVRWNLFHKPAGSSRNPHPSNAHCILIHTDVLAIDHSAISFHYLDEVWLTIVHYGSALDGKQVGRTCRFLDKLTMLPENVF